MSKKWVVLFNEAEVAERYIGNWQGDRDLLGGLGAKRLEMVRIGLPVPPGFTVTTEACTTNLNAGGQAPDRLWAQVLDALQALEKKMDVANT